MFHFFFEKVIFCGFLISDFTEIFKGVFVTDVFAFGFATTIFFTGAMDGTTKILDGISLVDVLVIDDVVAGGVVLAVLAIVGFCVVGNMVVGLDVVGNMVVGLGVVGYCVVGLGVVDVVWNGVIM
jgi:hypothetical protein